MKFEEYFYNSKPVEDGLRATEVESMFGVIEGSFGYLSDEGLSETSRSLLSFCNRTGIPVHKITKSSTKIFISGECDYAVIGIGEELRFPDKERLELAFAHEIGHFLDYRYNFKGDTRAINNGCIIKLETVAWEFAVEMLYNLGFVNWYGGVEHIRSCLKTYFDYYGEPENVTLESTINGIWDKINELSKNNSFEAAEKL